MDQNSPLYGILKGVGNTILPVHPEGIGDIHRPTRSILGDWLASTVQSQFKKPQDTASQYNQPQQQAQKPDIHAHTQNIINQHLQTHVQNMQQSQSQQSPTPTQQWYTEDQAYGRVPASTGIEGFTTSAVPSDYQNLITKSAAQNKINPALLASLLFTEHGFSRTPGINKNPDGSYDRGPAQINTSTHPEITDAQAMDPQFAIPWAAKTLASHIRNLGSVAKGIAAYNVGEGGATANKGNLGERGKAYLQKVLKGLSPDLIKQLGLGGEM